MLHRLRAPALSAVLAAVLLCACGAGADTTVSVQTIAVGSSATTTTTDVATTAPAAPPASTTTGPPDVISVADGTAVVERWNAARAQAYSTLDATPLAAVESSPALDTDTVELQLMRAGALRRSGAPTVASVVVDVPHQSAYPAVLYATQQETTGSTSAIELLGFTSAAAGAPWKLGWRARTPDAKTSIPSAQVGVDGFGANLDASAQAALVSDVPGLAARLAASFQPGARPDAAVVLDQGMPDVAATARTTISSFSRSGGSASVRFTGASTPLAIQTSDGGATCFVVVTYAATLAAAAGHALVETAAQHAYGEGLLAPGTYSQVVDTFELVFAAAVPAKTAGSTIFVYAIGGGVLSATGIPAPATSPSP
jgi:hypothetical protein